jgi:hypothetical protein
MFLKNCGYVSTWDHELLDERAAAPAPVRKPHQIGMA